MSDQARFQQDVNRYGASATITTVTGTTCPCMTSRDSARPQYSAQWHRDNPTASDCAGTGLISRSTSTTSIKAYFLPAIVGASAMKTGGDVAFSKEVIGELDEKDMIMFGPANASTGALVSIASMVERKDKVTYDGCDYLVRYYFNLPIGSNVTQYALLKRIA